MYDSLSKLEVRPKFRIPLNFYKIMEILSTFIKIVRIILFDNINLTENAQKIARIKKKIKIGRYF